MWASGHSWYGKTISSYNTKTGKKKKVLGLTIIWFEGVKLNLNKSAEPSDFLTRYRMTVRIIFQSNSSSIQLA